MLQRLSKVPALDCGTASLEVRLEALRRDGLRYRQGEDQHGYGGQASHGLIIGRRVLLPLC